MAMNMCPAWLFVQVVAWAAACSRYFDLLTGLRLKTERRFAFKTIPVQRNGSGEMNLGTP